MEFYLDLIHAIEFVISPVPYITALKVFMKSFKGVCLWDSLFVSGLNQCRTWNCFACYGIFSEVGTAILAGSTSEPVLLESFWSDSDVPIRARINYANPVYGVATICHQVRWLRWGHPSLFHIATSQFIWYKMFCMRDTSYRLTWMKSINMLSVYAQSETHRRFNWWIIAVLT